MKTTIFLLLLSSGRRSCYLLFPVDSNSKNVVVFVIVSTGNNRYQLLLPLDSNNRNVVDENHNISVVAVKWKKKLLSVISSRHNNENHNISVVAVWK
jgi:hypothetical protein